MAADEAAPRAHEAIGRERGAGAEAAALRAGVRERAVGTSVAVDARDLHPLRVDHRDEVVLDVRRARGSRVSSRSRRRTAARRSRRHPSSAGVVRAADRDLERAREAALVRPRLALERRDAQGRSCSRPIGSTQRGAKETRSSGLTWAAT